jgi:ribosomal protein S21
MSDPKDSKKPEIKLPENVPVDYTFEKTLKYFMKQVDKIGILKEVKMRRYFIKPSEIKRKLENERRRKNKTGKNQNRRRNT